jgi:hypothetical protein
MIDTRFRKIQLSEERPTERMNENPTKNQDPRIRKKPNPKILKIRTKNSTSRKALNP